MVHGTHGNTRLIELRLRLTKFVQIRTDIERDMIKSSSGLTRWLQTREEPWKSALADSRLHVAINQEIVRPDAPVTDGDEVAWFPPVTGG